MRKHGRVDQNQKEIVDALRGVGASVTSAANLGHGFPDLVVGFRGQTFLLEVKAAKGQLTDDEVEFMKQWRGHYAIVRSPEDALDVIQNGLNDKVMEF